MSSVINPEFIERYQLEYQKNPKSRVFAPLAEAYRKMGLLEEAARICAAGVQLHPEFSSGRVAYAKILLDQKNYHEALGHLEKAVQISPDNLMANSLLGDTLLELRRPKEALKAFKMVLFISPQDAKALAAVRKWEFLTADEYDSELFQLKPLFGGNASTDADDDDSAPEDFSKSPATAVSPEMLRPKNFGPSRRQAPPITDDVTFDPIDQNDRNDRNSESANESLEQQRGQSQQRDLERALSLADAFTIRNDIDRAYQILQDAKKALGPFPELNNRIALLARRVRPPDEDAQNLGISESLNDEAEGVRRAPMAPSIDNSTLVRNENSGATARSYRGNSQATTSMPVEEIDEPEFDDLNNLAADSQEQLITKILDGPTRPGHSLRERIASAVAAATGTTTKSAPSAPIVKQTVVKESRPIKRDETSAKPVAPRAPASPTSQRSDFGNTVTQVPDPEKTFIQERVQTEKKGRLEILLQRISERRKES